MLARRRQQKKLLLAARVLSELDAAATARPKPARRRKTVAISRA